MNTNIASRSKKEGIHPYLAFGRLHLEYRKFWMCVKKKKLYTLRVIKNREQRGCEISVSEDTENLNGRGSEQGDPTVKLMLLLSRNWTSRDPFQPELFHDSEAETVLAWRFQPMSLLGFFPLLCSCCSIYSLNCLTFCLAWAATGTLGVGCTQPSLIVCDSHTTSCSLWLNFMPSVGHQQPQLP